MKYLEIVYRCDSSVDLIVLFVIFWSEDRIETKRFFEMGIDMIVTSGYIRINQVVEKFRQEVNG